MEAPVPPRSVGEVSQTSLDSALSALFDVAVTSLNVRRCSLYVQADAEATLRLHNSTGRMPLAESHNIVTDHTVIGLVARTQVPLLVGDVDAFPTLPTHPKRYTGRSFLSVPVVVEYGTAAVLNAADRRDGHAISERDLNTAEMIGRALAEVLHSHTLARRAMDESEIDPTTGLYNRRHLERRLAQEVVRAQRHTAPLCLMLIAVECSDRIAASVPVQPSGAILRFVGSIVASIVRRSDLVLRYGPSQLAVLMPATPPQRARRVAGAIASEIKLESLPRHLRYDCDRLAVAVGLASLRIPASGTDLTRRAENALHKAQDHGGSAVVAAGDGTSELSHLVPMPDAENTVGVGLRLGVPYLADPCSAASPAAHRFLSLQAARMYSCLPIAHEAGTLTVAMADPGDKRAIHAVSQLTQMAVIPVVSPPDRLRQAITSLMADGRDAPGDA